MREVPKALCVVSALELKTPANAPSGDVEPSSRCPVEDEDGVSDDSGGEGPSCGG